MWKLFFEIKKGEIWQFETNEYTIENEIYKFVDKKTGLRREYHTSLYKGKEERKNEL